MSNKKTLVEHLENKFDIQVGQTDPLVKIKNCTNQKSKGHAATLIQQAWRRHCFHKQLNSNSYETLVNFYSDPRDKTLSRLMLGKTNAIFTKKEDLSFFPINPYVRQEVTSKIGYYRTDPISALENMDDVIRVYDTNPNYHKYDYIPITLGTVLSVDDIISSYAPDYKNHIEILRHPNNSNTLLAFIKIDKSDSHFFQLKKLLTTLGVYSGNFTSRIASLGLKSSYWQIALHKEPKDQKHTNPHNTQTKHQNLATTISELKRSMIFGKLKNLAANKKAPTYLLASTLLHLMDHIDDQAVVNKEALKRLTLFIDLATGLYSRNYNKFAFILYCVIHELTLLLNKKEIPINYKDFSAVAKQNTAKIFELPKDAPNVRYVAFPANSGTNALMLALNIAKKANHGEPCIKMEGPIYFEFNRLKLTQTKPNNATHDIYFITSGPTVWKGIYPGLDLNKVIRSKIDQGIFKPMTLIVDATSGMHRNLRIDDDLKKYILNGTISILVNESHQKFGLAHSDQAQYGYVYGVCGNTYDQQQLTCLEEAAEKDLQENIDMRIGSYLTLCAEESLERIKEAHFNNGKLLREFLSAVGLGKENILVEPNSLDDGLFIYVNSLSRVGKTIKKHFECRDSFGHFNTTWCQCGPFTRLTVTASDKIDVGIEASEIYFASFYSKKEMIAELSDLIQQQMAKKNPGTLSPAKQIRLIGLMQTLAHVKYQPKNLEQFEWSLAIKYLREYCPELVGRKSYQALIEKHERRFQDPQSIHDTFAKSVFYKLSKKEFPIKRAPLLLSLLKEYRKTEIGKSDPNTLQGLQAAVILCACTHLNVPVSNAKKALLANSAWSKAIISLNQFNALSSQIYQKLKEGQLASIYYDAIHSLASLVGNNKVRFSEILPFILDGNSDYAKAITVVHESKQLSNKIEKRLLSFKLSVLEKKKLSSLQNDLHEWIQLLEKDIYNHVIPRFENKKYLEIRSHFNDYISFAQKSRSNILKIISTALHHLIMGIWNCSMPSAPSRTEIQNTSKNISEKLQLFAPTKSSNDECMDKLPNNSFRPLSK